MNLSTTVQNTITKTLWSENTRLRNDLKQARIEIESLREQQNVVHRETEDRNQAAIELINGWIAEDDALQAAIDTAMWQAGERSLYRSLLRECCREMTIGISPKYLNRGLIDRIGELLGGGGDDNNG